MVFGLYILYVLRLRNARNLSLSDCLTGCHSQIVHLFVVAVMRYALNVMLGLHGARCCCCSLLPNFSSSWRTSRPRDWIHILARIITVACKWRYLELLFVFFPLFLTISTRRQCSWFQKLEHLEMFRLYFCVLFNPLLFQWDKIQYDSLPPWLS